MATPRSPIPIPPPPASPPSPAPAPDSARSRHPSSPRGMAAASAAKENAAPSASDATASASRRHGYAIRSCGVKKRPSRARLLARVPLRDITNLIEAVARPEAALGQEVSLAAATELTKPGALLSAVVRMAAPQDGDAAAKAARYSLRKGFR